MLEALEVALLASDRPDRAPGGSRDHVDRARTAFLPYSASLDQAFSPPDSGDLSLRENRGRPGAPPMEEGPLWHRMQAGCAIHALLSWACCTSDWPPPQEVLRHVAAATATQDGWVGLERELIRRLTPGLTSS